MDQELASLINQARYAQRLCERTARLYRRVQTFGTFATVIGMAGALTALGASAPAWVSITGAVLAAGFAAVNVALRPADKAAANEADVKRYAALKTAMLGMTADAARAALVKAQEADAPEIEPLRDVAFNDVLRETGNDAMQRPLKTPQRLLALLA